MLGAEPRALLAWREPDGGEPIHSQGRALRPSSKPSRAPRALAHQGDRSQNKRELATVLALGTCLGPSSPPKSAKVMAETLGWSLCLAGSTSALWGPPRCPSPTAL